ncbi:glyoxylase-like metal-dependent hydrolase (beta-lactamase superfamily II) [Salibacterium salarium]|uniref:MBL fold metallo-hydrolase n=1 Tax=Salibacterium salarium TaxID=284579 RepID=UPI002787697F|nr:MBL fold metallo-hydrolase [Salibacterium salarium]MDQ0297603.1 glyoxylase-like metal-dependent hydrolase (beta-lactamase superfamily II) [Salibacterium salarium]
MGIQAIQAKTLAKKVMNQENFFILDVRNEEQFKDWKVEGKNVEIMNKPYFELLDGVESIAEEIPTDKEVIVVCAKEGSSQFVADQLAEEIGGEFFYLEGGMKTWSEHLEPVKVGDLDGGGELYQFVRIGKGCLSYAVISDGEAAIVDPVRLTDAYTSFFEEKNVQLKHAIDTHLHADHVSGGRTLAEMFDAVYWLPSADATEVTFSYQPLEGETTINVGETNIDIQALYSPGHTIGSTSLIVDNKYLLTGDILFVDSIGRPDLAGKAEDWVGDLRDTLYNRYVDLDEQLIVLPAHFSKKEELDENGRVMAPLKELYARNHGLNIEEEETFRKTVTENLPPQPNSYETIRHTNMGATFPSEEEQTEMEIGPNRCAISS